MVVVSSVDDGAVVDTLKTELRLSVECKQDMQDKYD